MRDTTKHRKKALLTALASTGGNISEACKLCSVARKTFYRWQDQDPEFKKKVTGSQDAMTQMTQSLEEIKSRILDALVQTHGIISDTLEMVGISRSTYYNLLAQDPEFKKQAQEISEIVLDQVEGKLHKLIQAEDKTAILFYLKTKGKARGYIERQEHEVAPVMSFGLDESISGKI